jgi:hypothetical protein
MVVRTFDIGNGQAARDEDLSRESALLAVLATDYDVPSWIAAGQAMQRILLTTTAAGLKASFLNQPIEVPSLRRQLAPTLGLPGHPQLLLRFGYGAGGGPTPATHLGCAQGRPTGLTVPRTQPDGHACVNSPGQVVGYLARISLSWSTKRSDSS